MNLGLAIFFSAIFLGSIWLYYITRDRWNWKKIWIKAVKYLGLIILAVAIVIGIVQLVKYIQWKNSSAEELAKGKEKYNEYLIKSKEDEFIPTKAQVFWDVALETNKKDVVFYKGTPTKKLSDKIWLYEWGEKNKKNKKSKYIYEINIDYWVKTYLYFSNNKVTAVLKFYKGSIWSEAELINIGWYKLSSEGIFQYLGKPSETVNYNQDLNRIYFYPEYNSVFFLKANTVYGYGMFDSNYLEFFKKKLIKY